MHPARLPHLGVAPSACVSLQPWVCLGSEGPCFSAPVRDSGSPPPRLSPQRSSALVLPVPSVLPLGLLCPFPARRPFAGSLWLPGSSHSPCPHRPCMLFTWECLVVTPSATVTFAVELLFPLFSLKYLYLLFFVAKKFMQLNFLFSSREGLLR